MTQVCFARLNLRSRFPLRLLGAWCALCVFFGALAQETVSAASETAVKIKTRRDGNVTYFTIENSERCEVTMTFEFDLVNMGGSVEFPHTATFPPGATEAFSLAPIDPDAKWEFSYSNFYKLGSHCAEHDDSAVYLLPYAPGRSYKITQGYNGRFSHKGSNRYAIDWKMPEGTPIHAARGGVVVKLKSDSNRGGPSMEYDKYNNYVLIRHDDGTLAHYCHLKHDGVRVFPGQIVKAGDLIALSGNTGFSSGPHLHFCVFKTKNGRERESIPVKFTPANSGPITLVSGRSYRAAEIPVELAEAEGRVSFGQ